MEDMQSKGNEVFTTERKSVALDPEKHNEAAIASKRKKDKVGCCPHKANTRLFLLVNKLPSNCTTKSWIMKKIQAKLLLKVY